MTFHTFYLFHCQLVYMEWWFIRDCHLHHLKSLSKGYWLVAGIWYHNFHSFQNECRDGFIRHVAIGCQRCGGAITDGPSTRVSIKTYSTPILFCPDAFSQGSALSSLLPPSPAPYPPPNPWLSALQTPCWLGQVFLPSPHLSVWSPDSFYQLVLGGLFQEVGISASWGISAGGMWISVDMGILA